MSRFIATLFLSLVVCSTTSADFFGSGANSLELEFVGIGKPNNAADTLSTGQSVGSVPYRYRIGMFEISREMIEKANAEAGLGLQLADLSAIGANGPNKPATGFGWYGAAIFVNWLN